MYKNRINRKCKLNKSCEAKTKVRKILFCNLYVYVKLR